MKQLIPIFLLALCLLPGIVVAQSPSKNGNKNKDHHPKDIAPQPLNMPEFANLVGYPAEAKEAKIEGRVVVRVQIDKEGNYIKHIVVDNPNDILTKSVETHLPVLRFSPGIMDRKPIIVWVTIPFNFKLTPPEEKEEK